jgi:hypothetical protein
MLCSFSCLRWLKAVFVCVTLVLFSPSFFDPCHAQLVVLDLRDAQSSPSSPLPERLMAVAASNFGHPGFSTSPTSFSLVPLPVENAFACQPLMELDPTEEGSWPAVLLVRRGGNCTFAVKAQHAQAAGVAGMIVVNAADGNINEAFPMTCGESQEVCDKLTIPSAMLGFDDGDPLIRISLANRAPIAPVKINAYERSDLIAERDGLAG